MQQKNHVRRIGVFLGTYEDWGGASRSLLNFVRALDRTEFCPVVVVTKRGGLIDELEKCGIEYECIPQTTSGVISVEFVKALFANIKFLRNRSIDLIHVNHGSIEWKPPAVLAAKLLRIPIVYHYHSEIVSPSPWVRFADRVVVVSDYIRQRANSLGRPCTVVHNIVDVRRFGSGASIRETLNIPSDAIVITYVGQIKLIKGVNTLLKAIKALPYENMRFIFAGEFKEESPQFTQTMFEQKVNEDERVQYLGFRTDVQDLYASSDIIVMPSLYDEPCAMVLFEAAAAKKPIIASATGGTPEIIIDGTNGKLFPRNDTQALMEAIDCFYRDTESREATGGRAFTHAIENFSVKPVEDLQRIYRELAHG